jgi:hypothetical protein
VRRITIGFGLAAVVAAALLLGGGIALADNGTSPPPNINSTKTPAADPVPGADWIDMSVVELANLPGDTQIVDCWSGVKQLPRGVRVEVVQGFSQDHPGFHFLSDGRCALDSSATSTRMPTDRVDGGSSLGTSTSAFDLQWFGTGVDGGPSLGTSTCYGGDPLHNHCGLPTDLRSMPLFVPTGPGERQPSNVNSINAPTTDATPVR